MEKKTILLAEDEKNAAAMYKLAFEQAGYRVLVAGDGEEVLKFCREESVSIILLDINMPKKDGFEVLRDINGDAYLSRTLQKTPIIMLTNYSNPQDVEYCMKQGVQDYIVKSEWTPKLIIEKLKKYLG
jgi:CheY-like chemotaxis protein